MREWICVALAIFLAGCGRPGPLERPADPWFVDATRQAGIDFVHVNGASGRFYYPETNGSGCALFDADGDGWLDIFLVNAGPLPGCAVSGRVTGALYLNNRDGTFRNATAGSGLDVPFYGTGCCAGDYDNDGRPDLYVAAALGPGHLFRNLGGGRFEEVTKRAGVGNADRWGTACAWVDYDRDGWLDLFVGNYIQYKLGSDTICLNAQGYTTYCGPRWFQPDSPRLYRNLGDGRFQDVSEPTGLTRVRGKALGVLALDFNRDGWPDLFVANDVWENNLLENIAADNLEEERGRRGEEETLLHHSNTPSTSRRFRDVAVQNGVALSGSGKTLAGMGVDAADLLNDGRTWIAIANFAGEGVAIFRNDAPGQPFRDVSGDLGVTQQTINRLGFGLVWVDTDNDGVKEIFVANGHVDPEIQKHQPHLSYPQPKMLLAWDGAGRFMDVTARAGAALLEPRVSRGLAAGDYDNDGRVDLLVNNVAGPPQLLRNTRPSPHHWLGLLLEGAMHGHGRTRQRSRRTRGNVQSRPAHQTALQREARGSNRSGYGAEVTVQAGGRRWRETCRSGGSYVSQSDPRLHFGLGAAAQVETITIRWPGGATEVIRNVAADRYYTIVEGSGRATEGRARSAVEIPRK